MHMLDLMYAPTDWLTLVLPSFVEKEMSMRPLAGAPPPPTDGFNDGPISAAVLHSGHPHSTGGIGDTEAHGLFRLFDDSSHHLHLGLGLQLGYRGGFRYFKAKQAGWYATFLDCGFQEVKETLIGQ